MYTWTPPVPHLVVVSTVVVSLTFLLLSYVPTTFSFKASKLCTEHSPFLIFFNNPGTGYIVVALNRAYPNKGLSSMLRFEVGFVALDMPVTRSAMVSVS